MLNSCLEKYLIVYQFQNLALKNTRSNYILLPRMGLDVMHVTKFKEKLNPEKLASTDMIKQKQVIVKKLECN